jgi:hypothetical protein
MTALRHAKEALDRQPEGWCPGHGCGRSCQRPTEPECPATRGQGRDGVSIETLPALAFGSGERVQKWFGRTSFCTPARGDAPQHGVHGGSSSGSCRVGATVRRRPAGRPMAHDLVSIETKRPLDSVRPTRSRRLPDMANMPDTPRISVRHVPEQGTCLTCLLRTTASVPSRG